MYHSRWILREQPSINRLICWYYLDMFLHTVLGNKSSLPCYVVCTILSRGIPYLINSTRDYKYVMIFLYSVT